MTEQKLGPYYDEGEALSIARIHANKGEKVRLIEDYQPYQKKRFQHTFFVFFEPARGAV